MSEESQRPPERPSPGQPPEPSTAPAAPPVRRLMSIGGLIASLIFLAVWIGPITYVGSAGQDIGWMPRDLRHMQRVACLFTDEVRSWGTYHVEIRTTPGAPWVELPLAGYFDMSIFGYRNRFHRLVGKSHRRPGGRERSRYLAQWIAARYALQNPEAPALAGMRFVSNFKTVDELRKEKGRYCEPTLDELPPKRTRVLVQFDARTLRGETPAKGGR